MALKSIGEASKKLLIETVSTMTHQSAASIKLHQTWAIVLMYYSFEVQEILNISCFSDMMCNISDFLSSNLLSVSSIQIPPSSKSFQEAQSELNQTAADLNQSAGEVVHASRGSSSQLAVASGKFSQDFDEFLDAGIEMAGHTQVCVVVLFQEHQNLFKYIHICFHSVVIMVAL